MKKISFILILLFSIIGGSFSVEAQILKKLKNRTKKAAEEAIVKKTEQK